LLIICEFNVKNNKLFDFQTYFLNYSILVQFFDQLFLLSLVFTQYRFVMNNNNAQPLKSLNQPNIKFDGTELFDIAIIGAGPGGSFAAKCAAEQGYRVILIEKELLRPQGRYKACGGAMAWELVEEIGYPEEKISRIIESLVLHHTDGERYEKRAKGAVVWRSDLDLFLTEQAIQAGAICFDKCSLKAISGVPSLNKQWNPETDSYTLETDKGKINAKYIVAADGVYSKTLGLLNWPKFPSKSLVLTITKEIKMNPEKIKEIMGDKEIHLFFGIRNLMPLGYAWLFPKSDTVSVGWGNNLSTIKNVKEELQRFWKLPMTEQTMKNGTEVRDKAHLIPVDVRPKIYENGIFAVGDAGGFVDPISGKGIPYAMLSGKLAVESLKNAEQKNKIAELNNIYLKRLNREFLTMFGYKRDLRTKIFSSEQNLKRFLELWQNYRSSEIVLKKLF
jgi:geranylgeranyl reductase family protein